MFLVFECCAYSASEAHEQSSTQSPGARGEAGVDAEGGGGDGDGGGGASVGGNLTALAVAQMVNPAYVTDPSANQDIVVPAVIRTLLGPVLPLQRMAPIVM